MEEMVCDGTVYQKDHKLLFLSTLYSDPPFGGPESFFEQVNSAQLTHQSHWACQPLRGKGFLVGDPELLAQVFLQQKWHWHSNRLVTGHVLT
jgi:hypothetical protein